MPAEPLHRPGQPLVRDRWRITLGVLVAVAVVAAVLVAMTAAAGLALGSTLAG